MRIRPALKSESAFLSNLAAQSEAYWGYDSEYMDKFKSIYKLTEDFIIDNPTFVLENTEDIIGFYSLWLKEPMVSLELFFISPKYIGQGYGKVLWNHLITTCEDLSIKEFDLVTSPQAKDFYIKMGAVHYEDKESLLKKGRIVPRLVQYLNEN